MPKHGFLTPKAIANRIKSKGLQKLRWYCEMCQKQCRDENGFKCHIMSESHQRQLLLVAENQSTFVDSFSDQFLNNFLTLLRRRRVMATVVYNEYIADKQHIHMNATKWRTLTEFVKYLGREGHCLVDETPKGWFIQWIDRDPEEEARRKKIERREAKEKDEEDRQGELIREQMERDRRLAEEHGIDIEPVFTELHRQEGETIRLALQQKRDLLSGMKPPPVIKEPQPPRPTEGKRSVSMLEQLKMDLENKQRAKMQKANENAAAKHDEGVKDQQYSSNQDTPWLRKGIVVKIINKTLAEGKYHKMKGYVKSLDDPYTANIRLLDTKTTLRLDQAFLETVVPSAGGMVMILVGRDAGCIARLKNINIDAFSATLKLLEGSNKGHRIDLPYEHFSRLYEPKS
eukprot:gene210-3595_t